MRRQQEGYVLLGIVIGIVILGIFMTAAVPLWQKVVQREREQELIFRGYQYMQAIELYQRKFPGAFPPSLDILVEQKFLRKIYEDPMTESGEFRVLRQLSPELQMGGQQQQQRAGAQAGLTDLNRSRSQLRTPGGQTPGRAPQPTGGQFRSSLGRGAADASLGGIVGVASQSDEKTLYQVPGKEKYKDWLFVYGVQQLGAAQFPGQGGVLPGQLTGQQIPGQQIPGQQIPGQRVSGQQVPGQQQIPGMMPGQLPGAGTNPSPFPGLPPPPGLTSFRFGSSPAAAAPGQQPAQPGQPGMTSPGMTPRPGRPGQSQGGFGNPSSSFGQPQQQPRQQQPPRQP